MIINHEHRFIFLKTTKAAGTSIEISLSRHCGPHDVITPISPEDEITRQQLGGRGPQNLLVPLSRYSPRDWYHMVRRRARSKFYNHVPGADVKRWVGQRIWSEYFVFCFERNPFDKAISRYFWSTREGPRVAMDEYLRAESRLRLSNWHIYSIGGKIAVDFIGRYEHLDEDLTRVQEKLGLPSRLTPPRAKVGYRKDERHYSEVLDVRSRKLIEEVCEREIAEFGYKFETS